VAQVEPITGGCVGVGRSRVGGDRRGGQGDLGQGAIGDESGDQAGPGDGSAFVGATGGLEASVHAVDCRAGPVPEICQKLRNA